MHELGGRIKKGEKAHIVLFYKWIEKTNEQTEEEESRAKKTPMLRYYWVFNTEQCEGYDESIIPKQDVVYCNPIELCEDFVSNMPNPPKIIKNASKACYYAKRDIVCIPPRQDFEYAADYYKTLFHELIHSTGHETRLNRKGIVNWNGYGTEQYSFEELVAKIGSCYIMALTDSLPTIANSSAYIQSWLQKLRNNKRMVVIAGGYAQKAADYILNQH